MSLEQQIAALVDSTNALTQEVAGKIGEIDGAASKAIERLDLTLTQRTFAFKNRIINGDMRIDQRKAGAIQSGLNFANASTVWIVDRFRSGWNEMPTGRVSFQQVQDGPPGFGYSAKVSVTTAEQPAADRVATISHQVEASNLTDFAWGTADAAPAILSFWVKATIPGTYCVAISSGSSASETQFIATYVVTAANTWERMTISLPGPQTGVWARLGSSAGLRIDWNLGSGTNFSTGTKNAWTQGRFYRTPGDVNLMEQMGSWQITGVQLEKGSVSTPFEFRPVPVELALCQRYYYQTDAFDTIATSDQSGAGALAFGVNANWCHATNPSPPVPMRTAPTVVVKAAIAPRTSGTLTDWYTGGAITVSSVSAGPYSPPRIYGVGQFTAARNYAFDFSLNADF
ncbi:hypothetical protein OU995_14340 [Roseateles sp. SL47]|uniref:hypothetical protein n=1 Tax=Roseateles sp. SL47 TaxID=2995138 RepID=UPI002270204C|nr:hypothetical protein [Roseateles sp. SL47]WAC70799.1 hypothetical protein OU995_14340 [Roseateles sp. SL47]